MQKKGTQCLNNRGKKTMSKEYQIHPDFRKLSVIHPPLNDRTIGGIQKMMRLLFRQQRSGRMVKVERIRVSGKEGQSIRALLYKPVKEKTRGCLLYCYGGGYAFPAAPYQYKMARMYAERLGCRILFPDYRLAPEHPFPAAPEDCFAAYRWLLDLAGEAPVAVCGDSAGGTLAMAVCLMARDRHMPVPCAQLLTYPSVGDRGETESMRLYTDTPMCNSRDTEIYGRWYVQDESAGEKVYRSPIEAESFEGIPATYIETAQFDCLRDGAVIYANKLCENGIPVELHATKGTVHGYDMMLKSGIVKELIENRVAFLKKAFGAEPAGSTGGEWI